MSVCVFLLALGAALRITRFVNRDTLAGPFRAWVIRRWGLESKAAVFVGCPWCVGVWACAGTIAAGYWWGDRAWFVVPAAVLSAAWLVGIAALWLDEE